MTDSCPPIKTNDFQRFAKLIQNGNTNISIVTHEERYALEVIVTTMQQSPPLSVTMAERVAAARQWAVGRCVPADE